MNNEVKTIHKILPVMKLLFGTTAKKYPLFFVVEALKTVVQTIQPFVSILLLPLLIDELCGERRIAVLVQLVLALIISECVLTILLEGFSSRLSKYQEKLNNYFSMQIGIHSMGLDFQLTEDKKALDQLDRAKTGMNWYSGGAYGIAEQLFMLIGNTFKIVGFVTVLVMHGPWMLVFIAIYVVVAGMIRSKCNKAEIEAFNKLSKVNRLFGYFGWEIVDFKYGKDIRLYHAKDMLVKHWKDYSQESEAAWRTQGETSFKYNKWLGFAGSLLSVALYMYAGILVVTRAITVGIFSQMIEATHGLNATMYGLIWNVQEIFKRCNYAYEYVIFMGYPEAIEKNHDVVPNGLHTIEFKDVCFAYPNTEKLILDHINIKINPGEKLSIVGLNGAGKTTFIKLLCRLYDPTSGEILLDGKNIKEYDYKNYMEQFAPVFQDFTLFSFPLSENLISKEISQRTDDEARKVEALLKLVELDEFVSKNKNGIDTMISTIFDEEGVEPSGGEKQKMAIARALYKDAPVIILDEPTAALDPVAEYEIYKQFHTLVGDKTAFYISHRLSSCRFCDKIAVFSEGQIKEYGCHDELINIVNGIYANMFEAQAQYYR